MVVVLGMAAVVVVVGGMVVVVVMIGTVVVVVGGGIVVDVVVGGGSSSSSSSSWSAQAGVATTTMRTNHRTIREPSHLLVVNSASLICRLHSSHPRWVRRSISWAGRFHPRERLDVLSKPQSEG